MRTPLLLTALSLALLPTVPADAGSWSRSWMAAPLVSRAPADKRPELTDRTVRQVVRISSGGDRIRLRLSNEMSTEPLQLGAVHVALAGEDGRILPLSLTGGRLPAIDIVGYHRLRIGDADISLAVAPATCVPLPARRGWGVSIQIPALRHAQPSAFGDFDDVARAAETLAEAGADALAISPVHALYPGDGARFSPYAPSSRRFLNPVFADPTLLDLPPLGPAPAPALIDWAAAVPERFAALRTLYDRLSDAKRAAMERWSAEQGPALVRQALFDALHVHFRKDGRHGWQAWPAPYHAPDGAAAQAFAAAHAEEVGFYLFLQWLADGSLAAAQARARQAGMAVGLVADLAVGIDAGGADAWSTPDALLRGLSIGAPPDPLGPDGQNWGLTGFSPEGLRRTGFAPFIAMLRANLRHAGALRIDHGFGLQRLWVVPDGASAAEGAYLTFPFADLLRLVTLESHHAGAAIIVEDLGTVPDGFRDAIEARGMYGMRVLWFERDEGAAFRAAADYARGSVAMTGTHDTATVAGWWRGRDLAWNRALGRGAADEGARADDRAALWSAIGTGPQPPVDEPAPVVDAALAYVGSTPAALAIVPLEDLAALEEQPNLPGTIDEHPNWRRRMPAPLDAMLTDPATARRAAALDGARRA